MKHGARDKWFADLEAEGRTVSAPDPPSSVGVEWILTAWNALNTCRPVGMDVGAIPWTAANDYANRLRLTDDEFDLLWYCFERLERIHREHRENERRKQQKAMKHGHAKRTPRR